MMKNTRPQELSTTKIAISALGIAAVFLSTRLLQFPIPLGYAHLGNCVILLFASLFGPVVGGLAGGLGSALADLVSFPGWTLPTLIIKTIMGIIAGVTCFRPYEKRGADKNHPRLSGQARVLVGAVLTIAEMVLGYFLAGSILYGSVAAGATQLPGLIAEGIVAIALFLPLRAWIIRIKY